MRETCKFSFCGSKPKISQVCHSVFVLTSVTHFVETCRPNLGLGLVINIYLFFYFVYYLAYVSIINDHYCYRYHAHTCSGARFVSQQACGKFTQALMMMAG